MTAARLAQIPSTSLTTGSSLRKKRLLRMTTKLHHHRCVPETVWPVLLQSGRASAVRSSVLLADFVELHGLGARGV